MDCLGGLRWGVFVAHTPLGALLWPQIHLSNPEELQLKPTLKSSMCVYDLPAERPQLTEHRVWIDEVKEAGLHPRCSSVIAAGWRAGAMGWLDDTRGIRFLDFRWSQRRRTSKALDFSYLTPSFSHVSTSTDPRPDVDQHYMDIGSPIMSWGAFWARSILAEG